MSYKKVYIQGHWTKNYFNSDRGIRLIITPFDLFEEKKKRKKQLEKEMRASSKQSNVVG